MQTHLVAEEGLLTQERLGVAVLLDAEGPVVREEDVDRVAAVLEL